MKIIIYLNDVQTDLIEHPSNTDFVELSHENVLLIQLIKRLFNAEDEIIAIYNGKDKNLLRQALAYGCDKAIHINDKSQNHLTSVVCEIEKTGCDYIFVGYRTLDGETSFIASQIAQVLDLVQYSFIRKLERHEEQIYGYRTMNNYIDTIQIQRRSVTSLIFENNEVNLLNTEDIIESFQKPLISVFYQKDTQHVNPFKESYVSKKEVQSYVMEDKGNKIINCIPDEEGNINTTNEEAVLSLINVCKEYNILKK